MTVGRSESKIVVEFKTKVSPLPELRYLKCTRHQRVVDAKIFQGVDNDLPDFDVLQQTIILADNRNRYGRFFTILGL